MLSTRVSTVLMSSALLLLRIFVPIVQCQNDQPEWNSKTDRDTSFSESSLEKANQVPVQAGGDNVFWQALSDSEIGSTVKNPKALFLSTNTESGSVPNSGRDDYNNLVKAVKFSRKPNSEGVSTFLLNRAIQRPFKSQQVGLNPVFDYIAEDVAQPIQPGYFSSFVDNYNPLPYPQTKTKIKPRETRPSTRSFLFSNFKRARDGYMCHFKLCQVGVSGKRLSM